MSKSSGTQTQKKKVVNAHKSKYENLKYHEHRRGCKGKQNRKLGAPETHTGKQKGWTEKTRGEQLDKTEHKTKQAMLMRVRETTEGTAP